MLISCDGSNARNNRSHRCHLRSTYCRSIKSRNIWTGYSGLLTLRSRSQLPRTAGPPAIFPPGLRIRHYLILVVAGCGPHDNPRQTNRQREVFGRRSATDSCNGSTRLGFHFGPGSRQCWKNSHAKRPLGIGRTFGTTAFKSLRVPFDSKPNLGPVS
jgi:hypothetical protein